MAMGVDALTRMNVTYRTCGQTCQWSVWARSKPADPLPNHLAVCDKLISDFEVWIMGRMKQFMATDVQFIGVVATMLNPPNTAQSVKGYTTDFGQVAGDVLPPHDAAVLSLYTPYPGRRTHGRMYFAGIAEASQNQGILSATAKASIKNLADILIGTFGWDGTSPNYWWGVYSRKNGATRLPGPPPYISYSPLTLIPWTRYSVNEQLGTQRHRKLGRGI
jgi:hypothetical protein